MFPPTLLRTRSVGTAIAVACALLVVSGTSASAQNASPRIEQFDLVSPQSGDEHFGANVEVLSNGNYVVTDTGWDDGALVDVGAVYLYSGVTDTLISTLTGSSAGDRIGNSGIVSLPNGNFLVHSGVWSDGTIAAAGAVTFVNGASGLNGTVSSTNSLVGTTSQEGISSQITPLANGNYVVTNPLWDNGSITNAGAATFGDGTTGITGPITAANSLVGSSVGDKVGRSGVTELTNGNYVVSTTTWHNGAILNAGAATFGNGTSGVAGPVTPTNSLVGTTADEKLGTSGITALTNGNYVVPSPFWDLGDANSVGAVVLANGNTGITGRITTANSLHGTTPGDSIGSGGVLDLTNGNYVVSSPYWDHGSALNAGAVTFGKGLTGIVGAVTLANSLVGGGPNEGQTTTRLANGGYVVSTPFWDHGAASRAGAVTFGGGSAGVTGVISATNSLVGTRANDRVGSGRVTALTNGNYVVTSPFWDNGSIVNAGAATFGNGLTGVRGPVTASNSLVGSSRSDTVGHAADLDRTGGSLLWRTETTWSAARTGTTATRSTQAPQHSDRGAGASPAW